MIIKLEINGCMEEGITELILDQVRQWIKKAPSSTESPSVKGMVEIEDYYGPGNPLVEGMNIDGVSHDSESNLAK